MFAGLSLCVARLLCQRYVCMRAVCSSCDANNMGVVCSAVFSAIVVLFVLQLSLRSWCCLFRSCLCDRGVVCSAVVSAIVVLFVAQLSLRSWCLFVRAVVSALRQARCVFRSCEQERVVAVRSLNSCAWASVALSWPFVAAGAASVSRSVYRKRAMAEAMVSERPYRAAPRLPRPRS